MHKIATKLTSTIAVHISSSTGTQDIDVLPDSVVDMYGRSRSIRISRSTQQQHTTFRFLALEQVIN